MAVPWLLQAHGIHSPFSLLAHDVCCPLASAGDDICCSWFCGLVNFCSFLGFDFCSWFLSASAFCMLNLAFHDGIYFIQQFLLGQKFFLGHPTDSAPMTVFSPWLVQGPVLMSHSLSLSKDHILLAQVMPETILRYRNEQEG